MLRLFATIWLCLALLGSSVSAEAEVMTFEDLYTIEVPRGWTATQVEPGYMVFQSPDKKAVFLITTGMSLPRHRDKTAGLVKKYDALRLGAPDRFVSLMRLRSKRVAVTILGDHPDRVKMYRSIEAVAGDKMRIWRTD